MQKTIAISDKMWYTNNGKRERNNPGNNMKEVNKNEKEHDETVKSIR